MNYVISKYSPSLESCNLAVLLYVSFYIYVIDLNCMLKIKCHHETSIMIIIGEDGK